MKTKRGCHFPSQKASHAPGTCSTSTSFIQRTVKCLIVMVNFMSA